MKRTTTFRLNGAEYAVWSEPAPEVPQTPSLTGAEQAVLTLLLKGASNADIARHRKSSVRTVANQVASVFRKYGVRSRAELVARR
ncbi:MAG: response regulator transcription factor [Archangium sp.]